MTTSIPIFDGHNDVLLRLYKSTSSDVVSDFLRGEQRGHIDLKKARAGSFVGGLFAMYSPPTGDTGSFMRQMTGGRYAVPLPPPLAIEDARKSVIGELAILTRIERASKGEVAVCRLPRKSARRSNAENSRWCFTSKAPKPSTAI